MDKYFLKEVMLFHLHKFTGRITYNCSKKTILQYSLLCIFVFWLWVELPYNWIKALCSVRCKQSFLMPSAICIQCKKAYFLEVKYQYISMFYCFPGTAGYETSQYFIALLGSLKSSIKETKTAGKLARFVVQVF